MFKLRKWFTGFILVAIAIFLVACDDKVEEKSSRDIVMEAVDFLEENLPAKVLGDFVLPVFENEEVEIIFTPRTANIVDGVWKYNFPENDYREILDIKVTHGDYKTDFSHIVEVYGISDFDKFANADAELTEWIEELGTDITEDIELPAVASKLDITWTTNKKDVIAADGTYTRPNDDTQVFLTAIMKSNDVNYSKVLVLNAKGFTKEEKIDHFKTVDIPHLIDGSTSLDIPLPTSMSRFGFQIVWESSNTEVLANDGEFLNPDADTKITLKATIRYRMTLTDPADPTKGYRPLGETSFEEVLEFPFTVKALATELDRAAYAGSKAVAAKVTKHFYFGKVEGNKITDLPIEVEGYDGFTISYESTEHFTYNAEEKSLELVVQPLLHKMSYIPVKVTDGTEVKEISIPVNIGLLEEHQIGISPVSGVGQFLDLEAYKATNGFGNHFDGGTNIPSRDFTWNGLVFKSTFRWYHENPENNENAAFTETEFFFFFRSNTFINIKDTDLVLVEGETDVYTTKELSAKHSGSYLKGIHNETDKDVAVKGSDLKAKFGLQQHALYQFYIYDAEGNRTLAVPGTDVEETYVIPAGGYLIERGYIDGNATNGFFALAEKVEIIKVQRHSKYGG